MQEGSIDSCFHGKFSLGSLHFHTLEFDPWIGLDLLAGITYIVLYKLSEKGSSWTKKFPFGLEESY